MMTLRKGAGVIALAATVLLATPGTHAMDQKVRKRPFELRAHVVDFESGAHPRKKSKKRQFKAFKTHTIEFDVFRRGRAGVEQASQVKLYLPNGDLYSAVDVVPFEDESVKKRGRPTATARVRVSDTMITRYELYGKWTADVCWNVGVETSCRRGLVFRVR